VSIRLFYPQNY